MEAYNDVVHDLHLIVYDLKAANAHYEDGTPTLCCCEIDCTRKVIVENTDKPNQRKRGRPLDNGNNHKQGDPTYYPSPHSLANNNFEVETAPKKKATSDVRRHANPLLNPFHAQVDLMTVALCIPTAKRRQNADTEPIDLDMNKNHNHLIPLGKEGRHISLQVVGMTTDHIPKRICMVYSTPSGMDIGGVALAVVAYIFSDELPQKQVLVNVGHGDKTSIHTLVPRAKVVDDILDLVTCMLSHNAPRDKWYMPTTMMYGGVHVAFLEERTLSSGSMATIKKNHMRSKVDEVTWIYQPMFLHGHWFLMIIDVKGMKLLYLDSMRDPAMTEERKDAMMNVTWLSEVGAKRLRFSTFDFVEPQVCEWMIQEAIWGNHNVQKVNLDTRMSVAVDLVLRPHNTLTTEVMQKAINHWKRKSGK
ncbi:hypothetical protein PIB30_042183 [Stylosanthes scabra]|uniref:Ubiquitin-like protease family profile domain-containing protein n=1 Tax=Stylosanthes scabra TaxID=79078 RepID=A0ABU6TFS8_9FABA|nr:hypothetical protein [Stylosanthes scabra]